MVVGNRSSHIYGMSVFFLGSWGMNRSAEQTIRDIHNASNKDPF